MHGSGPPPATAEASSNGSLVARKRKKDVKPIIMTDDKPTVDRTTEAEPGWVWFFLFPESPRPS